MPAPTWPEYLAEATAHLEAVRATSSAGVAPPNPPSRPTDPMPEECRETVRGLAEAYDQLALEVVARMHDIDRRRTLEPAKNPHFENVPAQFHDIRV